jgi:hypothetical protein
MCFRYLNKKSDRIIWNFKNYETKQAEMNFKKMNMKNNPLVILDIYNTENLKSKMIGYNLNLAPSWT